MRLSRHNLTLHAAAGKGWGRPMLETIRCDRDGTVSSDGFRLTVVPYPDGPAAEDDPAVGVLIPTETADRAAAAMRPTDEATVTRPDDRHVAIALGSRDAAAPAVVVTGRCPDALFPDWRRIVPTDFTIDVAINPTYLLDALETLRQLGCPTVRLRMNGPTQPVLLEGYGGEVPADRAAYVLVMPMSHVRPEMD